jgi:hypothetical protein
MLRLMIEHAQPAWASTTRAAAGCWASRATWTCCNKQRQRDRGLPRDHAAGVAGEADVPWRPCGAGASAHPRAAAPAAGTPRTIWDWTLIPIAFGGDRQDTVHDAVVCLRCPSRCEDSCRSWTT